MVAQGDEDPSTGALELAVQYRVEDGVVVLHVLDQEGVPKAESRLQVLPEGVVQKRSLGDLLVGILVEDELGSLSQGQLYYSGQK